MGAIKARSGIEDEVARKFLEGHLGRRVNQVELIGEGAWSRCFGFEDLDRDLVVRFGSFIDDFEKDRHVSLFGSPQLPVPKVLDVGTALDGYFAISSRGYGLPLEGLETPAAWQRVLPSLFAALDTMRTVDLTESHGYGAWDFDSNAPCATWREFLLSIEEDTSSRRTYGWREKLAQTPGGDGLFNAGHARLSDLADDDPGPRHLIHCDLLNRNVLVEDGALTAVLDWGCSLYGDFLYDVALLEFWAPWFPALEAVGFLSQYQDHCAASGLEIPKFDARIQACLIHIGLDHVAYHAHTGRYDELRAVSERLEPMLA